MKSRATSKVRIDAAIQQCIMPATSLRELFMRDQIDWFSDNITVAYCTHAQGAAVAATRWSGAGARQRSRAAAATVAIDYVKVLLLTPFERCNLEMSSQ